MRGRFITVEGIEGVGKTTNISFIKALLSEMNIPFVQTREPGGTPLAEEIRGLLLANREEAVDATAELLLVFAARAQHFNQFILPALNKGTWVLCDRFTDATYAYQGYGRGLSLEHIKTLESLVQAQVQPDLTFYLDVDVQVGLERARSRGELDRFEQEDIAFFERVREGYHARIAERPRQYRRIDAGLPLDDVQSQIKEVFEAWCDR